MDKPHREENQWPRGTGGRWLLDSLISAAIVALVAAIWNMNGIVAGVEAQLVDLRADVHDMKANIQQIETSQQRQYQ